MNELEELVGIMSLRSDEVVEDMVVEIIEKITTKPQLDKEGRKYNKYIVPVSLDTLGSEKRNLWLMAQDARKIIKASGSTATKDYLGIKLKLGLIEARNKKTNEVMKTKEGAIMTNIVIKEVILE